jgi:hypothetical protein
MHWLLFIFIPIFAQAHPPANFPYEYQISADTSFIQTNSNFSGTGSTYTLPANGQLMNVAAKFDIVYRRRPEWHLYAGADYAYSKSTLGVIERTTGGLPYVRFGTRYFLPGKKFELIPVTEVNIAIRRVEPNGDDVLISDGATKIELGSWALMRLKSFVPYGYLGFIYHMDDFASPVVARLGSALEFSSMSIFGEAIYVSTVIDDKNINNPNGRWNVVNAVDGGSYHFYSVNPTRTAVGTGLSYKISPEWNAEVRVDYPLEGKRTSQGLTSFFKISWNLGETDEVRNTISKPGIKKPKGKDRNKKFKDKLEDEDQDLFE